MVAPIEQPLEIQQDLFGFSNHPQTPSLEARSLQQYLECATSMRCTCCQVGPTNEGKPPIMGSGNLRAPLALIGEAPGEIERMRNEAFVGPSGALLRKLLHDAGFSANGYSMHNVLKCRPTDVRVDPNNPSRVYRKDRKPMKQEAEACFPLLQKIFTFLPHVDVMVMVGETAAAYCLGLRPSFGILKHVGYGTKLLINGRTVTAVVVAHPSYLLQNKRDIRTKESVIQTFAELNNALHYRRNPQYRQLPRELFVKDLLPICYTTPLEISA